MKQSESEIQKSILEWLGYQKRVFCWRQNSGMRIGEYQNKKTGDTKRHVFKTASVSGVSDILGVWDGHPFAIEVKVPGKNPTAAQDEFLRNFAAAGGISIVARSLEQAVESFRTIHDECKPFNGIYIKNL